MVNWPFQRNKTDEVLPSEVKDYYQAEKREKRSLAWLLAGGTLLITVLLALGIFFGGRWVYRKIANTNPTPITPTAENDNEPSQLPGGSKKPAEGSTAKKKSGQTAGSSTKKPKTTPQTGPSDAL